MNRIPTFRRKGTPSKPRLYRVNAYGGRVRASILERIAYRLGFIA